MDMPKQVHTRWESPGVWLVEGGKLKRNIENKFTTNTVDGTTNPAPPGMYKTL